MPVDGVSASSRALYRGRFAPSPTGDLHFGSLVAAVGSWLRARQCGGAWLIRIEDIDPPREVEGAAARIIEALARFGMAADEPIEHQSERRELYDAALAKLDARGLLFACTCSRATLESTRGVHLNACLLDPTRADTLRVRVPDPCVISFDDAIQGAQTQDLTHAVGAFVVRRVEGFIAYQLAVVVDDGDQGITEIVRGADLLDSTPRQIYLQRVLDLPTPAYAHIPFARDANGQKLSKRIASLAIDPDDPMPALLSALRFLGMDLAPFAGLRSVEAVLALGAALFRFETVPRHAPFVP
jgi:glutamyl-Q tRNA(Asp) synthetase